jgi:hypothetical protein
MIEARIDRLSIPVPPPDKFRHFPEVLILDLNNQPIVKNDLVYRKPLIRGAKLRYASLEF